MKLIRRFDISDFLEYVHEFREIEKFTEPCSGPITSTLRGQFDCRRRLAKGGCPGVKMGHAATLQRGILQIPLHRIQFRHAVGDRRACREDYASPAG